VSIDQGVAGGGDPLWAARLKAKTFFIYLFIYLENTTFERKKIASRRSEELFGFFGEHKY